METATGFVFHFQRSNHLFTFRLLNKFVEDTWQRLHLQTEDRWLTTLSSLLHFGLAQRRQTLLFISPPPRTFSPLLYLMGTIHHANTINLGIKHREQGKPPSCHECKCMSPLEMQWCNVQGTWAVVLLMSGHPFPSCVT